MSDLFYYRIPGCIELYLVSSYSSPCSICKRNDLDSLLEIEKARIPFCLRCVLSRARCDFAYRGRLNCTRVPALLTEPVVKNQKLEPSEPRVKIEGYFNTR